MARCIEMNVWYVKRMSFFIELQNFFKRIFKVYINVNNVNLKEMAKRG